MSDLAAVNRRMAADWNSRAREDAEYYVAFGRRGQSPEEFFASAEDVLRTLSDDYHRLARPTSECQALEIGCGPGRLLLPLSHDFLQVTGIDVSSEMVEMACRNLSDRPNAEARAATGSDLADFGDASIDFVYSYAVFQHIPSRDVVLNYLREAVRVLRPGGVIKAQVNSLPRPSAAPSAETAGWSLRAGAPPRTPAQSGDADTWSGVSFSAEEIAEFCLENDLQLFSLEGFETQYLWFCARKSREGLPADAQPHIAGIANSFTPDRLVPQSGRFAGASLWVEKLPRQADLNNVRVEIDGVSTAPCYVRVRPERASAQVNVFLPPETRSGAVPVRLMLEGGVASPPAAMRVTPSAPLIPRLLSVSDGVNLLSDLAIETRTLKLQIEEVPFDDPAEISSRFAAQVGEQPLPPADVFCVDPLARRYELNLELPPSLSPGPCRLTCSLDARSFPPVDLEIRA